MTLHHCYKSPDKNNWQGRPDTPPNTAFFQIAQLLDLNKINNTDHPSAFCLLGFCCDEGVRRNSGRVGTANGPSALRTTLAKMPVHRRQFKLYDAGDIVCIDGDLETAQAALGKAVTLIIKHKITPIVIGGGHEVAYGHFQGIKRSQLDIINFDAHLDMRPLLENNQGSSGTPFLQIAQLCEQEGLDFLYHCIGVQKTGNSRGLFNTANNYNVNILPADDAHQHPVNKFLDPILKPAQHIYLTLCLDVFASGFAPGVSAPQPYGLTPAQIIPAVRSLAQSGKAFSYDIAELAPNLDRDNITAKLAAHLVFEIIHHHKFKGTHNDSSNTHHQQKSHTCT